MNPPSEVIGIWLRKIGGRLRIVIDAGGHKIGVINDAGHIVYAANESQLQLISNSPERIQRARRGRWYDPTPEEVESIWKGGRFTRCCIEKELERAFDRTFRAPRAPGDQADERRPHHLGYSAEAFDPELEGDD